MGYLMHLTCKSMYDPDNIYNDNYWYGTKVYGYLSNDEIKNLRSYEYLKSIDKLDLDKDALFFTGVCSETIELTRDEFLNFISEFGADLIQLGFDDGHKFEDTRIQKILDSNENVILFWSE